jgi:hypothetical protein
MVNVKQHERHFKSAGVGGQPSHLDNLNKLYAGELEEHDRARKAGDKQAAKESEERIDYLAGKIIQARKEPQPAPSQGQDSIQLQDFAMEMRKRYGQGTVRWDSEDRNILTFYKFTSDKDIQIPVARMKRNDNGFEFELIKGGQ